jgi:hypothetical protein
MFEAWAESTQVRNTSTRTGMCWESHLQARADFPVERFDPEIALWAHYAAPEAPLGILCRSFAVP